MKKQIIIWVSIFAVTMGIFEGAVVVYLRELYYPDGFNFPLTMMENHIAITELIRELASLFMLLSVGVLAGKTLSERFAWFIYSFAIWDIVYYIFLYLILGWPENLLTWDVLFLLPVIWTGPVITPIIVSFLMITLAIITIYFGVKLKRQEWLLLILGASIIFVSFIWDYCRFLNNQFILSKTPSKSFIDKLSDLTLEYIPGKFPWLIYILGVVVLLFTFYIIYKRNRNFRNYSS